MSAHHTAPLLTQGTAKDYTASTRKRKHSIDNDGADASQQQRRPDACEMPERRLRCASNSRLCVASKRSTPSATHETLQRLRTTLSPVDPDAPLADARPHASAHANLVALLRWARAVLYEDDVTDDAIGPREGTDDERDRDYIAMRAAGRAFAAGADEWRSIGAAPGRVRDGTQGNEIVARALWTVERLEAGMTTAAGAHSAAYARLEAVAAIRRLSSCRAEMDAALCADSSAWCRAVAAVGIAYRSAMRRRLVRIYVAYAPVAAQVDHMRDMGDEAPDGDIPTPRSVRAWSAAHENNAPAMAANDAAEAAVHRIHTHTRQCKRVCLTPPASVDMSSGDAESLPSTGL